MSRAKDVMREINSIMGDGTVTLASDPDKKVTYLPTGIFPIDVLLHGGLPRGRLVEIFGDYSTLKSYVALRAIAETQKAGGTCMLVDTENSFDPDWASQLGVDIDSLLMPPVETGEEAIDVVEVAVRNDIDLVVLDSVAATLPQDEQKKRMSKENIQPARLAALMSAGLRKITSANKKTALLFINQTRLNVGVTFGDPTTQPGGKAIGFYASHILSFKKAGKVREDITVFEGGKRVTAKKTTAQMVKVTVEKSKLSRPFRDVMLRWDLRAGEIDELDFLIATGLEHGLITMGGGGQWTMGTNKVRGADKFRGWLEGQPSQQQRLRSLVAVGPPGNPAPARKRAVKRKPGSSEGRAPVRTRTVGPARSSTTGRRTKK